MKLALDCFGRYYKKLDCNKCEIKTACGKVSNGNPQPGRGTAEEKVKNVASKILIETKKALCAKDGILLIRGRKVISNMFPSWQIDNETGKIVEGDSNELEKEKRTKHTKERKMFQVEDGSLFYLASIPSIPRIFLYKLGVDERGFSVCEGLHRSANQLAYWYHPSHSIGRIVAEQVSMDKLPVFDRVSHKLISGEKLMASKTKKAKKVQEEEGIESLEGLESLEELEELESGNGTEELEELEDLEEIKEEKEEEVSKEGERSSGSNSNDSLRSKISSAQKRIWADPAYRKRMKKHLANLNSPEAIEKRKKAMRLKAKKGTESKEERPTLLESLKRGKIFKMLKGRAKSVEEKSTYVNFLDSDGKIISRMSSPERISLCGDLEYLKKRFSKFEIVSVQNKTTPIFLIPKDKVDKFLKLLEKAKLGRGK